MSGTMTKLGAIALTGLALAMPAAPATASSASPVSAPPTAQSCTLIELLVVIALHDSSGRLVGRTTSDRNGRFTFKGLAPGTYRFTLSGDSLTKALRTDTVNWGDGQPGIIAILVGLLLPAGRLEPVGSDEARVVGWSSSGGGGAGKVSIQDISFTMKLPAPAGSGALKPGQTFDYQGTLSLRAR